MLPPPSPGKFAAGIQISQTFFQKLTLAFFRKLFNQYFVLGHPYPLQLEE